MEVKPPPAYSVEPETASALTVLFGAGSKEVTSFVARSIAARRFLVTPPINLKPPATPSCEPESAMPLTVPFGLGLKELAAAVVVSRAASWLRDWPPIEAKLPPAYRLDSSPDSASVNTEPSAF